MKRKERMAYTSDGNIDFSGKIEVPGDTVSALLRAGDIEGAKKELERLLLEGLDSGEPVLMTPEKWEQVRRDLHRKAKLAS